jgi:hypothetical protein
MTEHSFTNREIDKKFHDQTEEVKSFIKALIDPLTAQVTYTNGRMRKLERNLLIVSCVVGTILFLKYPEVIKIIQIFL